MQNDIQNPNTPIIAQNQTIIKRLNLKKRNLNQNSPEISEIPSKYPDIFQINLSYNNLTEFPSCLLKCENLGALDIRKNNFENFEDLINKLSNFKYLSDLRVDFSSSNQVQELLSKSKQLIAVNGKSTRDFVSNADIEEKDVDEISLEKSLPFYNSIFTMFQEKLQNSNLNIAKEFYENFQSLINSEASNINALNNSTIPNYSMANKVLKSEFNILLFFFEKLLSFDSFLGEDKEKIGKKIKDKFQSSINSLSKIIENLEPKIESLLTTSRKQIENSLSLLNESKSANGIDEKMTLLKREMSKIIKSNQEEKNYLQAKVEKLEKENKYMIDKLIKTGIQIGEEFKTIQTPKDKNSTPIMLNTSNLLNSQLSLSNQLVGNDSNFTPSSARELTLNMLKDIIKDIYQSKIEYDKRCNEYKLLRETMEQHMYSYLNTKYGLKNLVIEWASSIIKGIKQFSSEDSDICLFGKILRNEQEEESRLVLNKLKTTINDILEMNLKNKNPLKNRNDIAKMLKQKKETILLEEEWRSILYSIYQKDEANVIEKRLLRIIKAHGTEKKNKFIKDAKENNNLTRDKLNQCEKIDVEMQIPFNEFLHVITDYHIIYRDKYLKNFVKMFRKYDHDLDGVITEDQFIELTNSVEAIKEKGNNYIKMLLEKIDPQNFKKITFSNCVTLFSDETIEDSNSKMTMSILDKICLDGEGNKSSTESF